MGYTSDPTGRRMPVEERDLGKRRERVVISESVRVELLTREQRRRRSGGRYYRRHSDRD